MKKWLQAARLRTLPLSVSGILMGGALATKAYHFNSCIFVLSMLTTIGFQVISNFANDYGDGVKGTDNDDRIGPKRAIQTGLITPKQMLQAIYIISVLTFIVAMLLIYTAFGKDQFWYSILFVLLGLSAIWAAIKYTMGKNSYGYLGLGDVFVFLFFGLLSVLGSAFLYLQQLHWSQFLPAISIGLFSTAVLNLNNLRDYHSDILAHKNTLVVKIGEAKAKRYHRLLLFLGMGCTLCYSVLQFTHIFNFLYIFSFIAFLKNHKVVVSNQNPVLLDPELKKVALTTFLFAILFWIGILF